MTETIDENGVVVRAIDKNVLMQEISTTVVDEKGERYQFTWPDRKKSALLFNAPIPKALHSRLAEKVSARMNPPAALTFFLNCLAMDAVWENVVIQIGGIQMQSGNTLE